MGLLQVCRKDLPSKFEQRQVVAVTQEGSATVESAASGVSTQPFVQLAKQSLGWSFGGLVTSKAFALGASTLACLSLLTVGLLWMSRPRSEEALVAFCMDELAHIEETDSWQQQPMSDQTFDLLEDNFRYLEPEAIGAYCGEAGDLGSAYCTWKIRTRQGTMYVTEIEDAAQIENLGSTLRLLRAASPWSYAALRDGDSVLIVTSRARLQALLVAPA